VKNGRPPTNILGTEDSLENVQYVDFQQIPVASSFIPDKARVYSYLKIADAKGQQPGVVGNTIYPVFSFNVC
jgi:hypothetical protein